MPIRASLQISTSARRPRWRCLYSIFWNLVRRYADQCIANAQALGRALEQVGIAIHTAEGRGPTESHHLALPAAAHGGGQTAAKHLEKANILLCGIGLPLPPIENDLNGIRIGTQEITRFGMKKDAMPIIAQFMARVHGPW